MTRHGLHNWSGLIIGKVRIEVDETSLYDPDSDGTSPGSMLRSDDRLSIRALAEAEPYQQRYLVLHEHLPNTDGRRAAFTRWQAVIGLGLDKRVLWRTPKPEPDAT